MWSLSALAILASVAEAVQLTNSVYDVKAGQPFTLTWSGASGPVSIFLDNGPITNLKPFQPITSGATATSFTWTPPANLPSDTYTFDIRDSSGTNYSPTFQFVGSGAAATTGSSTTGSFTTGITSTTITSGTSTTTVSSSSSGDATSTTRRSNTTTTRTTSTTSTNTRTSATTTPSNTNNGHRFQSPLALVLLSVAALVYFN